MAFFESTDDRTSAKASAEGSKAKAVSLESLPVASWLSAPARPLARDVLVMSRG